MHRFFLALVCAAMVFLGASTSSAADAVTYTCDAYARDADKLARKQWFGISVIPGIVRERGKDVTVLVAFSGDPALDKSFRDLASLAKRPYDRGGVVKALEWMIAVYARELAGVVDGESRAVCWRSGTAAPDRSSWPGKTFTCAGVIWARTIHDGVDVSSIWPRWGTFRNVPTTNQSSAESMLRTRLLDAAKKKAIADRGRLQMTADQANGIPSSESMVCWDQAPPKDAPMGWPERVRPWSQTIAAIGQYSEWIEELPPPTLRNP